MPIKINETEEEVSIGTEIPDLYPTDKTEPQDTTCLREDLSSISSNFHEDDHEHGKPKIPFAILALAL